MTKVIIKLRDRQVEVIDVGDDKVIVAEGDAVVRVVRERDETREMIAVVPVESLNVLRIDRD